MMQESIKSLTVKALASLLTLSACYTLVACTVQSNVTDDIHTTKLATVKRMYKHVIKNEKSDMPINELQVIYENSNDELKSFITKVEQLDYETNECAYEGINTLKLVAGNGFSISNFDKIDYQITSDGLVQVDMQLLDTGVNGEVGEPIATSTKFDLTCQHKSCEITDIILDNYSVIDGLRRVCQ